MRLLICTQKVDRGDPILGFFHRWVVEFARHFESVFVICLEEGEHILPENVKVVSLGKEKRRSRMQYVSRFYRYINAYRDQYDVVFVHMNPEYIVLGGLLWRLWRKKIGLWYNHTYGTLWTRMGLLLAQYVFHTSPYAYTANTRKSVRMPAGIDTDIFKPSPGVDRTQNSVLYVGRLSPVKYIDVLIEAMEMLPDSVAQHTTLDVYGKAPEGDEAYEESLRLHKGERQNGARIAFHGSVPNTQTPSIYNTHSIFVNLTPSGNYDKTVLEAMACGTLTIVSSKAFEDIIDRVYMFPARDAQMLATRLQETFALSDDEYDVFSRQLREQVVQTHSLTMLGERLANTFL